MIEIKEKNIYNYQSIADKEPIQVKVTQVHEYKKKIRVEVSRDLANCLNPFRVDANDLISDTSEKTESVRPSYSRFKKNQTKGIYPTAKNSFKKYK